MSKLVETKTYPISDLDKVLVTLNKLANDYLVWPDEQYALEWAIAFIKSHTNAMTGDMIARQVLADLTGSSPNDDIDTMCNRLIFEKGKKDGKL